MRDLIANLFARLRATSRQERLYVAAGVVAAVVLLRFGLNWLVDYRRAVKEDIQLTADRLANARRLVTRGPEMQKQLGALQQRYGETVAELVPGDTPTLAAAALQERVSSLAAEKNVSVQTTQVMKDEALGPFRKVSLRITANGELRQLADFLADLEFGPLRVSVPFIELNRRGAARRDSAPRSVSATIEIAGVVQGTAAPRPAAQARAGGDAQAAGPEAVAIPDASPPPAPLQDAGAPAEAPVAIPDDPLGTGRLQEQRQ